MANIFTKKNIKSSEMIITCIASNNRISPLVLSTDNHQFTMERWPATLTDIPCEEWYIYKKHVLDCLCRLHSLRILHGDLSEDNIVVDPISKDARLIDFGRSFFVDNADIEKFNEDNDFHAVTHDDMLLYDYRDVDIIFG